MLSNIDATFTYYNKTDDPIKRNQLRVINYSALITAILGSFSNIVITLLNYNKIPDLADVIIMIWILGIIYSIISVSF